MSGLGIALWGIGVLALLTLAVALDAWISDRYDR